MLGDAASMPIPEWYRVVSPGAAIVIALLAFDQFGSGPHDVFDLCLRGANP